jgi:hypothetical protein
MPAGTTYEPIATYTVSSAQASYTFSSISGSYTDLVLIINGAMSTTDSSVYLDVNGNASAVYSTTSVKGNGSTATSSRTTSNTFGMVLSSFAGYTTSQFIAICNLQNYSNTTTYKTLVGRWNQSDEAATTNVSLWRNTNAITSITIKNNGSPDNFIAGTTFTLYGIASA